MFATLGAMILQRTGGTGRMDVLLHGRFLLHKQRLNPLDGVCGKGVHGKRGGHLEDWGIRLTDRPKQVAQIKARVRGRVTAGGTYTPPQLGPVGPLR